MNIYTNDNTFEKLLHEYLHSLSNVRGYHAKLRKDVGNTYDHHVKCEIGLLNSIVIDLHDSILGIERYLPIHKQSYLYKSSKKASHNDLIFVSSSSPWLDSPENYICDLLMQKKILATIHQILTPRQFEIIYLYFYENMNQSKIATLLDLSRPTVTEHLQKALNKIKGSQTFLNLFKNYS